MHWCTLLFRYSNFIIELYFESPNLPDLAQKIVLVKLFYDECNVSSHKYCGEPSKINC